jgi:hypothetical protein
MSEKRYTKVPTIVRYIERELTDSEKGLVPLLISSISSYIDNYTGRNFDDIDVNEESREATERLYDGNGERELFIDDVMEIEKVQFLDLAGAVAEEIPAIDYIAYPMNSTPINSIYLCSRYFPRGKRRVKITASFSSGTLPKDVIHAATALVALALSRSKTEGVEVTSESIEGYTRKLKDGADFDKAVEPILMMLDKYQKIEF